MAGRLLKLIPASLALQAHCSSEHVAAAAACDAEGHEVGLDLLQLHAAQGGPNTDCEAAGNCCDVYNVIYNGVEYTGGSTVITYDVGCGNDKDISHFTLTMKSWPEESLLSDGGNTWNPGFEIDDSLSSNDIWSVGPDSSSTWPDGETVWGVKADSGLGCSGAKQFTVALKGTIGICPGESMVKAGKSMMFCPASVPCTDDMCDSTPGCIIEGDPHIETFDEQTTLLSALSMEGVDLTTEKGHFWVMMSDRLEVQGRFAQVNYAEAKRNGTYMVGLAATGPALEGNVLEVYPQTGRVLWNKKVVKDSEEIATKLVTVQSKTMSALMDEKAIPGVDVSFGQCSSLVVNRRGQHLDMKLKLPRSIAGKGAVGGQCGNFNGKAQDDEANLIAAQPYGGKIPKEKLLFSDA